MAKVLSLFYLPREDLPSGPQTSFSRFEAPPKYSISWQLLTIWVIFDVLLLAAGITFIALSLIWWDPNPIRLMVLSDLDLFAGLILGTLFVATFLCTLPTAFRTVLLDPMRVFPNVAHGVVSVLLAVNLFAVIVCGAIVWWRTLRERVLYFGYWEKGDDAFRELLQERFQCCGYFDQCPDSTLPVCVDPIQDHADHMLNAIFTSMFAMSAIIVSLILASGCIVAELRVLDRYRRIDVKRGRFSFGKV